MKKITSVARRAKRTMPMKAKRTMPLKAKRTMPLKTKTSTPRSRGASAVTRADRTTGRVVRGAKTGARMAVKKALPRLSRFKKMTSRQMEKTLKRKKK